MSKTSVIFSQQKFSFVIVIASDIFPFAYDGNEGYRENPL